MKANLSSLAQILAAQRQAFPPAKKRMKASSSSPSIKTEGLDGQPQK